MKRHDVSNPGQDTRYPENNRDVILWRKSGPWTKGFFNKDSGFWASSGGWLPLDDIASWSDPTEPESAEPVARVNNDGFIVECGDLLLSPGMLLYATPPDTAAVMRQAPIGRALAMRVLQSDLYRQIDDTERAECDALIHDHLAALRGALPQPKESQHD